MEAKYSFSGFDGINFDDFLVNGVYTETFPFKGFKGVFLTASVDNSTVRQRLVMTHEDESGRVLASDGIDCIHTAVCDISLEQAIDAYPDEDKHVEFINAHTSEGRVVDLEPSERFLAFKSWVQGIAEAGPDAFMLQSSLEAAAGFAYPIASKLLSFVVRNTSGCLDLFFESLEQCKFEGGWHVPSLIANLKTLTGILGSMTVEQKAYVTGCMISAEYPVKVLKDFTSLPGVADYLSHKLLNGGYPVNVLKEFAGLPMIAEHLLIIEPELKVIYDLFIKGKLEPESGYKSVPDALELVLDEREYSSVATLPQLIAGKVLGVGSYLSKDWFNVHSWEVVGTHEGQEYYLAVHGPLLSPARIRQAIKGPGFDGSAELSQDEFNDLFNGKLPSGEELSVYDFEELITLASGNFAVKDEFGESKEVDPFGHYILRAPYELVKEAKSGQYTKEGFVNSFLVQLRLGTKQFSGLYFDKVQRGGKVGNYHRFSNVSASSPRAWLLFVRNDDVGLYNYNLDHSGRFVGVARATD